MKNKFLEKQNTFDEIEESIWSLVFDSHRTFDSKHVYVKRNLSINVASAVITG